MPFEEGTLVQKRYHIVRRLGKGGMASVYLAEDTNLKRQVAIKVLPREMLSDSTFRDRFQREAEIIAGLERLPIVPVHDYGEEDGQPFLVMSYMPGGSLEDVLRKRPLSLVEAVNIFTHLAKALDTAHARGIVHRDLKPGNILFDEYGKPYISDFGIVKVSDAVTLTSTSTVVGTPAYMSPEQGRGEPKIDGRSDIYSLGAILFQVLTGRLPYDAATPTGMIIRHISDPIPLISDFNQSLPHGCQQVINQAMAKRPEDRYQTVGQMVGELQAVIRGLNSSQMQMPLPSQVFPRPTQAWGTGPQAPSQARRTPSSGPISVQKIQPSDAAYRPARRTIPWMWLAVGGGVLGLLCLLAAGIGIGYALINNTGGTPASLVSQPAVLTRTPPPRATMILPSDTPQIALSFTPTPLPTGETLTPVPATSTPLPSSDTPAPLSLGIGSTQLAPVDGVTMVYVPAGEFVMGSQDSDPVADPDEKPQHTVYVDSFWIDQLPVTNALFSRFVSSTGYVTMAEKQASGYVYRDGEWIEVRNATWLHPHGPDSDIIGLDQHPVVQVNYEDAWAYCRWVGRRLPTEAEWEKAARGADGRIYPWGNQPVANRLLNFADKNFASDWSDLSIDDGYEYTSLVGAYRNGASPYGALDMAGNVRNWVQDWYDKIYYSSLSATQPNPQGPTDGEFRVARGGSWGQIAQRTRSAYRDRFHPIARNDITGFRCVLTP